MTGLEKVSAATMRFMRGKYALDEVGNGKDELKFRRAGKTVLTIYIREGRFDFLVVFGKAERAKFEARRDEFPQKIRDIYDAAKTFHDGKWIWFGVSDLETLEVVKELILIKKKPNRKPFPKDGAVYGDCGHRCDLCQHYAGLGGGEKFRAELRERVRRVYCPDTTMEELDKGFFICPGCANGRPVNDVCGPCEMKKCAAEKSAGKCMDCKQYPCDKATEGLRDGIQARSVAADDVTWAILPYVPLQYGN
ncbi:MAG: DUF3788 family protein [Kiritimatiellaeota bacterium]|nr:DUF3788 family protein [Kiritimatiellota bacterium]